MLAGMHGRNCDNGPIQSCSQQPRLRTPLRPHLDSCFLPFLPLHDGQPSCGAVASTTVGGAGVAQLGKVQVFRTHCRASGRILDFLKRTRSALPFPSTWSSNLALEFQFDFQVGSLFVLPNRAVPARCDSVNSQSAGFSHRWFGLRLRELPCLATFLSEVEQPSSESRDSHSTSPHFRRRSTSCTCSLWSVGSTSLE
jgi:hypothetical protein